MMKQNIEKSRELEFAIFCIENVAAKLGVSAEKVYNALAEKSDILNGKTKRDASGRALSVKELKRQRYLERERNVGKRKINLRMHNTEKDRNVEKSDRWGNPADRTEKKINLKRNW